MSTHMSRMIKKYGPTLVGGALMGFGNAAFAVEPDWSTIYNGLAVVGLVTGILAVAAMIAPVLLTRKGARIVLSTLK